MRVDEIKYKRADIDAASAVAADIEQRMRSAASGAEMAEQRGRMLELVRGVSGAATLCEIRFAQNMADGFYAAEKNYYDENMPRFNAACVKIEKAFLNNAHLPAALEKTNPAVAKIYELNVKTTDEKIIGDSAEEAGLVTEYSALMSGLKFRFRGKTVTLPVLEKFFFDADRKTRAEAMSVLGRGLDGVSGRLDGIFGKLVAVRARKAKKMGISDYSVMGDMLMGRYSYGREEIKAYRERTAAKYTPIVAAQKEDIARRLGLPDFKLYDNEIYFIEGNPAPKGGAKGIFAAARNMYKAMGKETDEFFRDMERAGAFDVFPRENKWGGGFCACIDNVGQPFILANFNGSSGDVDVLTHEAGHALAFYLQEKSGADYELCRSMPMSEAEVHSMAMEFFAYPYAGLFFDRPDDYREMHYKSALTFLPYGCEVDEFEETCYKNPDMTPAERNALWLELEKKYRPYLTADGIPYLEKGTRWQYQSHIYENPMYYIDYCLAGETALDFLELSRADYKAAFEKYTLAVRRVN